MAFSVRAIARGLMPKWVNMAWSGAEITRELIRLFGQAYKTETLYADYREFKGVVLNELPLKNLRATTKVPKSMMSEAVFRRPRRYLVAGRAQMLDVATGVIDERFVSWYADVAISKEDLAQIFIDASLKKGSIPGEQVLNIDIVSVRHNKDMSY
jgi:hypothetical protein